MLNRSSLSILVVAAALAACGFKKSAMDTKSTMAGESVATYDVWHGEYKGPTACPELVSAYIKAWGDTVLDTLPKVTLPAGDVKAVVISNLSESEVRIHFNYRVDPSTSKARMSVMVQGFDSSSAAHTSIVAQHCFGQLDDDLVELVKCREVTPRPCGGG
jgi:hypothetical protein